MSYPEFNRNKIIYRSLSERQNKLALSSIRITAEMAMSTEIPDVLKDKSEMIADRIIRARRIGSSIICAFGAHSIKNGLGSLLGFFIRKAWFLTWQPMELGSFTIGNLLIKVRPAKMSEIM